MIIIKNLTLFYTNFCRLSKSWQNQTPRTGWWPFPPLPARTWTPFDWSSRICWFRTSSWEMRSLPTSCLTLFSGASRRSSFPWARNWRRCKFEFLATSLNWL